MNHEELIVQAHTPQTRDSGLPSILHPLASLRTELKRGDCVEIGTDPSAHD